MDKHKHTTHADTHTAERTAGNEMGTLAENARALMSATADVAGEKVAEARKRLSSALESAKEMAANVRDTAIASAKATDKAVRKNPYKAVAIGVGVGALIGFFMARRGSHRNGVLDLKK